VGDGLRTKKQKTKKQKQKQKKKTKNMTQILNLRSRVATHSPGRNEH